MNRTELAQDGVEWGAFCGDADEPFGSVTEGNFFMAE
jgi:hypothetical protein